MPSLKARALSYAQYHFMYVFKLLYPRHLCFDYGYACVPAVSTFRWVASNFMSQGGGLACVGAVFFYLITKGVE